MKCLFPAVICFSLLLSLTAPAIAVEYEYIGIPTPSWWKSVFPLDINDNGTVVGRVGLELPPIGRFPKPSLHIEKGFIYNGNNYTELLPTLLLPRYRVADAASVNNSGVVVGSVATLIPFYPLANFYEILRRGFIYFGLFTLSCCLRDGVKHTLITSPTTAKYSGMARNGFVTIPNGSCIINCTIPSCSRRNGNMHMSMISTRTEMLQVKGLTQLIKKEKDLSSVMGNIPSCCRRAGNLPKPIASIITVPLLGRELN